MRARRETILDAARKRFASKGYAATSIQDIAQEAGVSFGNIYTHFPNKHAMLEALSGSSSRPGEEVALDLTRLIEHLVSPAGFEDAKLDLNLWAEATRDELVNASVQASIDAFRRNLRSLPAPERRKPSTIAMLEALALGMEVQRSLGRKLPSVRAVKQLVEEGSL